MRRGKIVQFVCFETTLDTEQFIRRWEDYKRSVNSDLDVILQQSEKDGAYKYIAQHYCAKEEIQFDFTKAPRSSRIAQAGIKTNQAGGYSVLHSERKDNAHAGESKVFVFLVHPKIDLNNYTHPLTHSKLNVYQAYYENCRYSYILEFFVKNKYLVELVDQLKQYNAAETGIYKECVLHALNS
jgi:hypothetical protein